MEPMTPEATESIGIEALIKLIESECGFVERTKINGEEFMRVLSFVCCGTKYYIEWWKNLCTLSIGNRYANYVQFDGVYINRTWPSFRSGIAFTRNGERVALIATKLLDWQEKANV